MSLTIALGLALGGTAAIAAPVHSTKPDARKKSTHGPTPTASTCTKPDKAKCLSIVKVNGEDIPFLETTCGITHREDCRQFVAHELEVYGAATADNDAVPSIKMLRPFKTNIPGDVKSGKYHKHTASASRLVADYADLRQPYKKTNDLLAGYAGRNMNAELPLARKQHRSASEAIKYWRNTGWRDNGPHVGNCKEYAYARSFTATRFIDAASDCRGDRECIFDVAFSASREGISDRFLYNEDGTKLSTQLHLPSGKMQKNDLFPKGVDGFVRANGREDPLEDTTAIVALEHAMIEGQTYYDLGPCSGASCNKTRKFTNVWKWHDKLHDITATVGEEEAEEYERRRAQFRRLLDEWNAAVAAEAIPEQRTVQEYVSPLEMRAYDPFERYDREGEYIERGRDQRKALQKKFGKQLFQKNTVDALKVIRGGAAQQHGSYRSGTPAIGVLGMPAPASGSHAGASKAKTNNGPKPKNGNFCVRDDLEWGLETGMQGPISCRIGQFLRDEWDRLASGQRSCLDLENQHCDWTMGLFEASVLAQLPALDAQLSDEQYCKAYLDTKTFKDDAPGGLANVTEVKKRLDATRDRVEKELAEVGEFRKGRGDVGQKLGKDWTGGDYAGDKESFGAGYDYDIGWEIEPAQKIAEDAADNPGLVCAMKGTLHGNLSFDAFLVGKKFPVVSGAVSVRSIPGTNGDADYNAHLKMFDISLYNPKNAGWKGTQSFGNDDPKHDSVSIPDVRPRFDVMVGFVPVSGQLWGDLMFGSILDVGGNASTACNATAPRFAIHGSYTPTFMAFGTGKVGVGIAGLVSAGIKASLLLAMIGTPIEFGLAMATKEGEPSVQFSSNLRLLLGTLGGRVSLYLEFLLYEEEFELFRWKGVTHEIPLMIKAANVSLVGLK